MKPPKCDYENWDGVKYEEDKAMYAKMERNNSNRLHFSGACLKKCRNRDIKCDECIRYSEFEAE